VLFSLALLDKISQKNKMKPSSANTKNKNIKTKRKEAEKCSETAHKYKHSFPLVVPFTLSILQQSDNNAQHGQEETYNCEQLCR
jgi:hypothetical protein